MFWEVTNEEKSYKFTSAAQVTSQSHRLLYGQWLSPWGPAFGERKLGWPGLTWVDKVSIKGATLLRGINSDLVVAPFGPPPRFRSRRWLGGAGPAWTSGHSPEVVWQRRTAGRTGVPSCRICARYLLSRAFWQAKAGWQIAPSIN